MHLGYHTQVAWRTQGGPDMHFYSALSLVGLGMAALTTAFGAFGRMPALGIVVFPLAAASLLAYRAYGHADNASGLGWRLQLHAWMALLAYATLALSAVLAIFLWAQERALRRREFRGWLRALPPLTELESLLFRSITVGFVLLTATLLTGLLFVDNLLAQHLVHKTVLSVLSWLAFGALLLTGPLMMSLLGMITSGLEAVGSIWEPAVWPFVMGLMLLSFAPFAVFSLFSFVGGSAVDQVASSAMSRVNSAARNVTRNVPRPRTGQAPAGRPGPRGPAAARSTAPPAAGRPTGGPAGRPTGGPAGGGPASGGSAGPASPGPSPQGGGPRSSSPTRSGPARPTTPPPVGRTL